MFDIVSVGHLTIDTIILPDRNLPLNVLGGSATYASLAARRLNATVSVVSKVGGDFPNAYMSWLEQEGINLSGMVKVENAQTTRFELKYNRLSNRKMQLKSRTPPITLGDLPESLKAKIIHIAPIAYEITYEVVVKLRSCTQLLSLDPQGLLRNFSERGNVTHCPLTDKRILEFIDVYKSTLSEIKAVTGMSNAKSAIKAVHAYGVEIVIVTLGMKGALLSNEKTIYNITSYKSEKIVDPTGAGDAFIGSFLAEYIQDESLLWCARVGSAAASLIIETVGPKFSGDKAEIYRRARTLYEKEIK